MGESIAAAAPVLACIVAAVAASRSLCFVVRARARITCTFLFRAEQYALPRGCNMLSGKYARRMRSRSRAGALE